MSGQLVMTVLVSLLVATAAGSQSESIFIHIIPILIGIIYIKEDSATVSELNKLVADYAIRSFQLYMEVTTV